MNSQDKHTISESLLSVETASEMELFLSSILTPKERQELPKRLAIFALLKQGVPQHEIAERVGVGVATVTRGSIELQRGQIQKTAWWRNQTPVGA